MSSRTYLGFEHHSAPLLPRRQFFWRLARHAAYAFALIAISLVVGVLGFHFLAEQRVIDALLNACMLLGGMGPVGDISSTTGKLFASGYALYAGLVFIGVTALLLGPIAHRLMHRFHLQDGRK